MSGVSINTGLRIPARATLSTNKGGKFSREFKCECAPQRSLQVILTKKSFFLSIGLVFISDNTPRFRNNKASVINDEEFPLLYDMNTTKTPDLPNWTLIIVIYKTLNCVGE